MDKLVREDSWKKISYGMSVDYRKHWGDWEMLREIYQNSLDEANGFKVQRENGELIITDSGEGFGVRHLLFGITEKKNQNARGQFGEGLKFSMLIALRKEYSFFGQTGNLQFKPKIEIIEDEEGPIEVFAIEYRRIEKEIKGTNLRIGYSGSDYQNRIILDDDKRIIFSCVSGKILKEELPKIYCKGIYVQNLSDLSFSYDIKELRIDEGRNIAELYSIQWRVGSIWSKVKEDILIYDFFRAIDQNKLEKDVHLDSSLEFPDSWKKAFFNYYGKNAVIGTCPDATKEASYKGAKVIVFGYEIANTLKKYILTDVQLLLNLVSNEDVLVLEKELERSKLRNLYKAKEIVQLFRNDISVKPYFLRNEKQEELGRKTLARWVKNKREIRIDVEVLADLLKTLESVVHELAHAIYLSTDLSFSHTKAVEKIASKVIIYLRKW